MERRVIGVMMMGVAVALFCSCAHTTPQGAEEAQKRGAPPQQTQKAKDQKPRTAEEELKQGDYHLARGDVTVAIAHYQNALKKDPSLARAHLQMAKAYGKQRTMDQYEKELKEALTVDPALEEARYLLASWYFTAGRTKEALAESETLIKSDPANEKYRLFRVMVFDATKEYHRAIDDLAYLVKAHPQKPQYLLSLGGMYHRIGDENKARQYLQKVKEIAPESFEAKMANDMLNETTEQKK